MGSKSVENLDQKSLALKPQKMESQNPKIEPIVLLKLWVPSEEVQRYILAKIPPTAKIEELNKKIYSKAFIVKADKGKHTIVKFRNCKRLETPITFLKFLDYGKNRPRVLEILGKTNTTLGINYRLTDQPQKKARNFYIGNIPVWYYTK